MKIGSYIYHEFGPTYLAAMGAHLYWEINVPYCHILFPKELLLLNANSRSLAPLDFDHVNGYTIEDFRKIWKNFPERFETIRYLEIPNTSNVELIIKHPSCFKSKSEVFDSFVISRTSALFQKNE